MSKISIIILLSLCLMVFFSPITHADITDQLSFSFSDFDTATVLAPDSNYYVRISSDLPKQAYPDSAGCPELPMFIYTYSLPSGEMIDSVTITSMDTLLLANLSDQVYPRQSPHALCYDCTAPVFDTPSSWYDSTIYPPEDQIALAEAQYGFASGMTIGSIKVRPIYYNLSNDKIWVVSSLSLTIHTSSSGASALSVISRSTYTQARIIDHLKIMVENPGSVESNMPSITTYSYNYPTDPVDIEPNYLIITSNEFEAEMNTIEYYKNLSGFSVEVKTVEDIYTEYTGSDNPEKIRNYIKEKYQHGAEFVLLMGNMDVVPIRYYGNDLNPARSDIPTDLYYAALDNWTEPYNCDLVGDIWVGRVAISDTGQATVWTEKLINYIEAPGNGNSGYTNDVIMATADQMVEYGSHERIASRIPYWFNVDIETLTEQPSGNDPFPTGPTGEDVIDELSDPSYVIFYSNCHGSPNWYGVRQDGYHDANWSGVTTDTWRATNYPTWGYIGDIENEGREYVHFSISCYLGALDCDDQDVFFGELPPDGYGYARCLAEDELLLYGGAVAGTYNTRVGWVSASTSLEMTRAEWLFGPNGSTYGSRIGPTHYVIKSTTNSKEIIYGNTLFGDPSMFLWGGTSPRNLVADYPDSVMIYSIDSTTIIVKDSLTQAGIPNVMVTLSKGDEVFERGYTNSTGNMTPKLNPQTTGWITVSCLKGNYILYKDSIEVVHYCADAVAGDANGDGSVLGGDITYLVNYFRGGTVPPDSCMCPTNFLYHAADANGDCSVIGGDVSYLISYFGGGSAPVFCSNCPNSGSLLLNKKVIKSMPVNSIRDEITVIEKKLRAKNNTNVHQK